MKAGGQSGGHDRGGVLLTWGIMLGIESSNNTLKRHMKLNKDEGFA